MQTNTDRTHTDRSFLPSPRVVAVVAAFVVVVAAAAYTQNNDSLPAQAAPNCSTPPNADHASHARGKKKQKTRREGEEEEEEGEGRDMRIWRLGSVRSRMVFRVGWGEVGGSEDGCGGMLCREVLFISFRFFLLLLSIEKEKEKEKRNQ